MASLLLKSFIHAAYLSSGKNWQSTIPTLEAILIGNFNVLKTGQGSLLSTTINGKSLSFTVPPGMTSKTIIGTAQLAWEYITNSLACDSTGAALNQFLLCRATSTTVASFAGLNNYGSNSIGFPSSGGC